MNVRTVIALSTALVLSLSTAVADERSLLETARDKGLLFFFSSDCPYCHRLAPVLQAFEKQYGFTVLPISLDGAGIPGYEQPKANHTLAHQLNVRNVPAVFLIDPERNTVANVSVGYRTWTELQQRVTTAALHINRQERLP